MFNQYYELKEFDELVRQSTYRNCLFSEECSEQVIKAHSVSRAVLARMQSNGHLILPTTRFRRTESGLPERNIVFGRKGINRVSTGEFVCRAHDDFFSVIDTTPLDYGNPRILNLLFYRAILREIWLLLRMQRAILWVEKRRQWPGPLSIHPYTRTRALLDVKRRIEPFLKAEDDSYIECPVVHLVRFVRSSYQIVAASNASGGSTLVFDDDTGNELPQSHVGALTGREPNESWGFTVIPEANQHVVVASWLKGSSAEKYFDHFKNASGKELEAAVSAELICFCENWFLSPRAWESYGGTKREAILSAYKNLTELQLGKYRWADKGEKCTMV